MGADGLVKIHLHFLIFHSSGLFLGSGGQGPPKGTITLDIGKRRKKMNRSGITRKGV